MIGSEPGSAGGEAPPRGRHGGDARMVAQALGLNPDRVLDLSMSLNPFAPDPAPIVLAEIARGALTRYPDQSDVLRATAALADALGAEAGRVLITNGGSEAIALVAAELGRGWVDEPDFSLYRRHLATLDPGGPRFRSDPHNPSGLLAGEDESAAVWDEAFYPLATGVWTRAAFGAGAPRDVPAVVIGSLTKVLGCPGLRLGYVVVPEDGGEALGVPGLRERLGARQPEWSVGTAGLAAVPTLLERADLQGWARAIRSARAELCGALRRAGLVPRPSDANFVLVESPPGLRDQLARNGVIVRDCTSFGLPDLVRVAVPDGDGLARLVDALSTVDPVDPISTVDPDPAVSR